MNTPNGHEHRTSTPAFLVSQLLVGDPQMQEIIKNTPPTEIILALIHLIRPSMELFALHWHLCQGIFNSNSLAQAGITNCSPISMGH